MREYISRAVVLDKEWRNGADARYSFFTERFGKIAARAKSSRKIVSKLAGHLEPGMVSSVRIIEQYGTQVVDALKISRVEIPLTDLASLNKLLPEWESDEALWRILKRHATWKMEHGTFDWAEVLAILGWDPRGAVCVECASANRAARHFFIPRQEFFCASCASNFPREELLLI